MTADSLQKQSVRKNERTDLSQADRNNFRRLTALLVARYARRTR